MKLEKEYATYEKIKDSLVAQGSQGKFVVIKDEDVFDTFVSYEDALRQGMKKYGNVPFLIKEVSAVENINCFHHGLNIPECQVSA